MRSVGILLIFCAAALGQSVTQSVNNANGGGASTSIAVSGFTCASGNKVLVFVNAQAATTVSSVVDSTGANTYTAYGAVVNLTGNGTNLGNVQAFVAPVGTTITSGTVTGTINTAQSFTVIYANCISGGNANDFAQVGGGATGSGGFNTSITSGSFTTTNANEIVFILLLASANTFTAGSGYTIASQNATSTSGVEYQVFTGIQTGATGTATISGGANWATLVIGIKGAAGASPTAGRHSKPF